MVGLCGSVCLVCFQTIDNVHGADDKNKQAKQTVQTYEEIFERYVQWKVERDAGCGYRPSR